VDINNGDGFFHQFVYIDDFVSNCTIWNLPIDGSKNDAAESR
jgi:hypothetical protein